MTRHPSFELKSTPFLLNSRWPLLCRFFLDLSIEFFEAISCCDCCDCCGCSFGGGEGYCRRRKDIRTLLGECVIFDQAKCNNQRGSLVDPDKTLPPVGGRLTFLFFFMPSKYHFRFLIFLIGFFLFRFLFQSYQHGQAKLWRGKSKWQGRHQTYRSCLSSWCFMLTYRCRIMLVRPGGLRQLPPMHSPISFH